MNGRKTGRRKRSTFRRRECVTTSRMINRRVRANKLSGAVRG